MRFSPTATVEVSGTMSVDLSGLSSPVGVRSVARLHTSTHLDAVARATDEGRALVVTVNMPKDAINVVEAKAEVQVLRDGHFAPIQEQVRDQQHNMSRHVTSLSFQEVLSEHSRCTSEPIVGALLGAQACATLHLPPSLSEGPVIINLGVQKTDTFDNYIFAFKWAPVKGNSLSLRPNEVNAVNRLSLSLDTPRSQRSHRLKSRHYRH